MIEEENAKKIFDTYIQLASRRIANSKLTAGVILDVFMNDTLPIDSRFYGMLILIIAEHPADRDMRLWGRL